MISPYAILEVAEAATDEEIKKAYLAKVRKYPPEQNPRSFQRIRGAFEAIRTEKDRLKYRLFHYGPPDLELLDEKWLTTSANQGINEKTLTGLLAAAVRDYRSDKG